jgi:hypothetical protein
MKIVIYQFNLIMCVCVGDMLFVQKRMIFLKLIIILPTEGTNERKKFVRF